MQDKENPNLILQKLLEYQRGFIRRELLTIYGSNDLLRSLQGNPSAISFRTKRKSYASLLKILGADIPIIKQDDNLLNYHISQNLISSGQIGILSLPHISFDGALVYPISTPMAVTRRVDDNFFLVSRDLSNTNGVDFKQLNPDDKILNIAIPVFSRIEMSQKIEQHDRAAFYVVQEGQAEKVVRNVDWSASPEIAFLGT